MGPPKEAEKVNISRNLNRAGDCKEVGPGAKDMEVEKELCGPHSFQSMAETHSFAETLHLCSLSLGFPC